MFDELKDDVSPDVKKEERDTKITLKYDPRPEQVEMRDFTMDAINKGFKFILMDAPVGIGKSYYAVMLITELLKKNSKIKFDILTSTKLLQSQYADDFAFINNLWGAGNYECERYECRCDVGQELCALNKSFCADCPHALAKESYFKGQVSLTNYHLYILYAMYAKQKLEDRGASILIVDEAHEFDSIVCDFVSVKLNKNILKKLGLDQKAVEEYDKAFKTVNSLQDYVDMIRVDVLKDMKTHKQNLMGEEPRGSAKSKKDWMRKVKDVDNAIGKFEIFLKEYDEDPDNWIFEKEENKYTKGENRNIIDLFAQPIWSKDYLEQYVWSRYDHVILMSGTILDKKLFTFLNGLKEESTVHMKLNSPFPVDNRKIYYIPAAKMSYDNKRQAFEAMVPWLKKILKKYSNKKGIIHTVSFELANWILEEFQKDKSKEGQEMCKRLLTHDSSSRDLVLRRHTASKEATILVSPSMFVGVDLKEDLSRFQIILKIPYPNLGSSKIKKRKDIYPPYYGWRTVADIVQSYGRSVRSMTDEADTYVLDSNFDNLLRYNSDFIPKYVKEAIRRVN